MPVRLAPRQRDLAERHIALVRVIARVVARDLSAHVELAELEAFGFDGLLRAAKRFKRGQGVAFATFARYRIRGAMYDAARSLGLVQRGTAKTRRSPCEGGTLALLAMASSDPTAEERALLQEACILVRRALEFLPARERQFLLAVYYEGKLLMDAGATLGISKSAATRLHARAVARLRTHLNGSR